MEIGAGDKGKLPLYASNDNVETKIQALADREVSLQSLDRLSNLSVELIDKIINYLSVKDAVRTSVLSKFWWKIWMYAPDFILDSSLLPSTPIEVQSKEKHGDSIIHLFQLHNYKSPDSVEVSKWILLSVNDKTLEDCMVPRRFVTTFSDLRQVAVSLNHVGPREVSTILSLLARLPSLQTMIIMGYSNKGKTSSDDSKEAWEAASHYETWEDSQQGGVKFPRLIQVDVYGNRTPDELRFMMFLLGKVRAKVINIYRSQYRPKCFEKKSPYWRK